MDSEQLLLQLLEQAEAAEAARRSGTIPVSPAVAPGPTIPDPVSVSDQTPPPARIEPSPLPLPEFNFDAQPPTA